MVSIANRAEKQAVDALLADADVLAIYGASRIFQGYVAPNTLTSTNEYVYLRRIDSVSIDRGCVDDTRTDRLRRVRLQVDVSDTNYTNMVARSEIVRAALTSRFPDCIDGDTYGTATVGTKVFNVTSIDVILTESEV